MTRRAGRNTSERRKRNEGRQEAAGDGTTSRSVMAFQLVTLFILYMMRALPIENHWSFEIQDKNNEDIKLLFILLLKQFDFRLFFTFTKVKTFMSTSYLYWDIFMSE